MTRKPTAPASAFFARLGRGLVLGTLLATGFGAHANEAAIRKNLPERLPNFPTIDEVRQTPMPGLFEVRINGTDIIYTDAQGNFVIQGVLLDTVAREDLTKKRIDQLTALPFDKLPLKDAFKLVRGNGERQMAVFEDPNCSFCKRLERDLARLENTTIYIFLYPILGQDSVTKSNHIWCAKDRAKAWEDWMLRNITPPAAECDTSAIARNVEFGRVQRITGTPTTFFVNGTRLPGAVSLDRIEQSLQARR
ncbi:MAG: DsbC family protein [Serpentinimonas sp.]|jgi:thiol:disulfide interchange protein DsbC|nr:DsbC family protein [Serpentinimonas sp.]